MLYFRTEANIETLLASAKAAERAGLVAQATRRYRNAFTLIARQQAHYPAETFARLPSMLSAAGLKSEAWYEYCELLIKGCPGRDTDDQGAMWNDRASLFDKMRSFLQHEGEHANAVIYGALFYIARVIACQHQPDRCHIKALRSVKTARSLLLPLLRRADRTDALPLMASELQAVVRSGQPDMIERAATILAQTLHTRGQHATTDPVRYPMPPLHYLRADVPVDALQHATPATP